MTFSAGAPRLAVIRLYGWKYEPAGPAPFSPMRSNRERMKSPAARFSSVSVSRPRSESPARKNKSARISFWRIDSFWGARCCASAGTMSSTTNATTAYRFSMCTSVRTTDPLRANKIHQPDGVVGQRGGDVKGCVTWRPVVGEVRRGVHEHVAGRGQGQGELRQLHGARLTGRQRTSSRDAEPRDHDANHDENAKRP